MALARKIWKTSRFHKGLGNLNAEGMFWWAQNLDFEMTSPYLRVAQKLLKETDSAAVATLADIYWGTIFDSTNYAINMLDGKIFKYNYPSWSEVHDNANAWGGLGLFGDSQINNYTEEGFLYYASNGYAGRYVKTTDTWTDSWQSFAVSNNAELCPITKFLKFICFGNQRYVAAWDTGASSWNATRITLPLGYKIKWFAPLTDYLVICAYSNAYGAALFFWDGISSTYNRVLQLPNLSAPAGVVDKNRLYVITGDGWINLFDGSGLTKLNRFPDMEAGDINISINPDAVKVSKGVILIGMRAHGFNMEKRWYAGGIWCFNPETRALYFKHTMSHGGITNISGTGVITIGSIMLSVNGDAFRAAWYKGGGSGQYIIDVNNDTGSFKPYDWNAIIVSPLFDDEPYRRKRFIQQVLNFWKPMPDSSFARYVVKYSTEEKYQKYSAYATGGGSNYFTMSFVPTAYIKVGYEVTVVAGNGAGQIRHITAISGNQVTVDETLYGGAQYDNTCYLLFTPFQKIGVIKGNENVNAVNKLFRFNARAKKIQIKVEIWSPSGYTGQWDLGLSDMSTVYVPDRIIK